MTDGCINRRDGVHRYNSRGLYTRVQRELRINR